MLGQVVAGSRHAVLCCAVLDGDRFDSWTATSTPGFPLPVLVEESANAFVQSSTFQTFQSAKV